MRTPVESYVVRIYRRQGGAKRRLVGLVQSPGVAGTKGFESVEQLWEILVERKFAQRTEGRIKNQDSEDL
jgi:hypothetical protein